MSNESNRPVIPDGEEVLFFDLGEARSMPSTPNVCPTLTCSNLMGKSIIAVSQETVGFITSECGEILHGIQRGWTAAGGRNTETQRCRLVGNGIPLQMTTFIAENYMASMNDTAVVDVPQTASLLGNMIGFPNVAPILLPHKYEDGGAAPSKRKHWSSKDVTEVATIDIEHEALPPGGIFGKETDYTWREMPAIDICPRVVEVISPSAILPYLEKDLDRARTRFDTWHPRIAKEGWRLAPSTMAVLFNHGILTNGDDTGPSPSTWTGRPYIYNHPTSGPMIVEEVTQLSVDCGRPIVGKDKFIWMARGGNAFVVQLPSSERALDCKGLAVDRKELLPTTGTALQTAITEVTDANREGSLSLSSFSTALAEAHLLLRVLEARDKISIHGKEDPMIKLSEGDRMILSSRMTAAADNAKSIEECKDCAGCKNRGTACIFRELLAKAAIGRAGALLAAKRRRLVGATICIEEGGEMVDYKVINYSKHTVSHELKPVHQKGEHQEIALWALKGAAHLLENSPDFDVERAPKRTKI